jgi:hypothetical protein
MNKAQPYAYWIVSGALLLVLLIIGLFFSTPHDADDQSAADVKLKLDGQMAALADLKRRAGNSDPHRLTFNSENKDHITKLLNDYLISTTWDDSLKETKRKYENELNAIMLDLTKRSKILHAGKDESDIGEWYLRWYDFEANKRVTELAANGSLEVEAAKDDKKPPSEPERLKKARLAIGLYSGEYPPESRHRELTAQLRIVERISRMIIGTSTKALPNPAVRDSRQPVSSPPIVLTKVNFDAQPGAANQKADLNERSRPSVIYMTTVEVKGTESSLMALLAAIDSCGSPIMVVNSCEFVHIEAESLSDVERKSASVPLRAVIKVAVLDFAPQEAPAAGGPGIPEQLGARP